MTDLKTEVRKHKIKHQIIPKAFAMLTTLSNTVGSILSVPAKKKKKIFQKPSSKLGLQN